MGGGNGCKCANETTTTWIPPVEVCCMTVIIQTCFHSNLYFAWIYPRKAREDIVAKNLKLAQMEADYGDVVPRRDYEKLNERFQLLEKDSEKLKNDHKTLMKEHK